MTPAATVVTPTYNRAAHLKRTLDALELQDVAPGSFEVVVVDDGSSDGTSAVLAAVRPYALRSLRQANGGPGAARNAAIGIARGDVLVFVDDDVIPAPDLVRRHLDAQAEFPAIVTGRMLLPDGVRQPVWAEWEGVALERQYTEMAAGVFVPTPRQFYTANASVPREAVKRAGFFDESFRRAEDVELAYRLADIGLPFRFAPEAIVVHDTPRAYGAWMRMAAQYGQYDIVMWRDKRRTHILTNIAEEQQFARKASIRSLGRSASGRAPAVAAVRAACSSLIRLGARGTSRRIALAACSALFNVLYLDGACREFGGRTAFWDAIDAELKLLPLSEAAAG